MPMSSSSVTVLGFLLLSAPALAGDVYSFTVDQSEGSDSLSEQPTTSIQARSRGHCWSTA